MVFLSEVILLNTSEAVDTFSQWFLLKEAKGKFCGYSSFVERVLTIGVLQTPFMFILGCVLKKFSPRALTRSCVRLAI